CVSTGAWSPGRSQTGSGLRPGRRGTRRGTSRRALRRSELLEKAQLFEKSVGSLCFCGVHQAESEPHVDEDVVSHRSLGELFEAGLLDRAAEIDTPHAKPMVLEDLDDLAGDSQTHQQELPSWRIRAAIAA